MARAPFRLIGVAASLAVTGIAGAHHPAKMERCESLGFAGEIVRLEWRRPHVELFVQTDEGVIHELTWLAINQLALAGIDQNTLAIGDRVDIVAGIRPNDVVERPMLLSYIHRNSDDWSWTQTPQGC